MGQVTGTRGDVAGAHDAGRQRLRWRWRHRSVRHMWVFKRVFLVAEVQHTEWLCSWSLEIAWALAMMSRINHKIQPSLTRAEGHH